MSLRSARTAAAAVLAGAVAVALAEALLAGGLGALLGGGAPARPPGSGATAAPRGAASPDGLGAGKGIALRHGHHAWGSHPGALESDLADVDRLGADWIRVRLEYSPAPDPDFDRLVSAAEARGIRVLVTLGKPAPLTDLGTEEDRALFRRWAGATVARYRGWVRDWEVLNEPNLHLEWSIDETTGDDAAYRAAVLRYVTHLRDAHDAITAADPDAVVHLGGLSEWTMERYLGVLLATDAHRYVDVIDIHPYGRDPDAVVERYRAFRTLLAASPAYADLPVWITEVGFNTTWPALPGYVTSEAEKAARLAAAIDGLRAAGARLPIFWYTLHENDASPGFGLLVKDPATLATTYLPAFEAYRSIGAGPGTAGDGGGRTSGGAWYDTP